MKNKKNIIKNYLDKDDKVKGWPAKRSNQLVVLEYIASKFQLGVEYTEKEVNEILMTIQTANDHCFFRRELFEKGFLDRSINGSTYWKRNHLIKEQGETSRLIIKDAVLEEVDQLQELYDTSKVLQEVLGIEYNGDEIYQALTVGDLPPIPNAKKEYNKIKSLYLKETNELIGILNLYHGYPTDQDIFIGLLYIHFDYQKQGYGKEVVEYLLQQAEECNFEKLGVGVNSKNASGLKFWHKCQFDKIRTIVTRQDEDMTIIALEREVP